MSMTESRLTSITRSYMDKLQQGPTERTSMAVGGVKKILHLERPLINILERGISIIDEFDKVLFSKQESYGMETNSPRILTSGIPNNLPSVSEIWVWALLSSSIV